MPEQIADAIITFVRAANLHRRSVSDSGMGLLMVEEVVDGDTANLKRSVAMFKRILVPLDGSARAEYALPIAARIARAMGGSPHLLEVVSPLIDYGGGCDLIAISTHGRHGLERWVMGSWLVC